MRVFCIIELPIGNSMLPPDCQGSKDRPNRTVLVPTDITVGSAPELDALMEAEPERFDGYRWLPVSEVIEPRQNKAVKQYKLELGWGDSLQKKEETPA
jgi:hypothetical protein